MASDDKYDRQIRLWGSHGQKILSSSHILLCNYLLNINKIKYKWNLYLVGANPSGTETLKNLVLPGIKRFTVVDG